jgi:hypothetical protein
MRTLKITATVVAWAFAVALGLRSMLVYELTPAAVDRVARQWPADSALIRRGDCPALVMFVHPHCPCSRASLAELAELSGGHGNGIELFVVFLKPAGLGRDWEKGELWHSAESIPRATLVCDDGGVEAARFGASASGETLFFDKNGSLKFHGGLTPARGHRGANAGREAIESLLSNAALVRSNGPVFGCSLREPTSPRNQSITPDNSRDSNYER